MSSYSGQSEIIKSESRLTYITFLKINDVTLIQDIFIISIKLFNIFRDSSLHSDQKQKLLHKLESKFPDSSALPVMSNFKGEPNADYEKLRRRIEQNTQEQWNYLHSEVLKVQKIVHEESPEASKQMTNILSFVHENTR